MIIESELRHEIARVVGGDASLVDLYRWLMARNWNVLRNSDAAAIDLSGAAEEVLQLWRDSILSESQAIRALSDVLMGQDSIIYVGDPVSAPSCDIGSSV